ESTQGKEVGQVLRSPQPQLRGRERVQPQQVVPALERVATEPVDVEPSAPGDEDALPTTLDVVHTLEEVAPGAILVDLVENPEITRGQFSTQDALAVLGDVPVQVAGRRTWKTQRQSRLAHLAGTGNKDHLPAQVLCDLRPEVSGPRRHGASVDFF